MFVVIVIVVFDVVLSPTKSPLHPVNNHSSESGLTANTMLVPEGYEPLAIFTDPLPLILTVKLYASCKEYTFACASLDEAPTSAIEFPSPEKLISNEEALSKAIALPF